MSTAAAETARAGAAAELAAGISLGIYEKALRSGPLAVSGSRVDGAAWRVFLDQVPRAGFSFLDLSIDESPEREARLDWDAGQCRTVRRAAEATGTAAVRPSRAVGSEEERLARLDADLDDETAAAVAAEREAARRASVYVPSRHAGRVTRDMGVREAVSRDGDEESSPRTKDFVASLPASASRGRPGWGKLFAEASAIEQEAQERAAVAPSPQVAAEPARRTATASAQSAPQTASRTASEPARPAARSQAPAAAVAAPVEAEGVVKEEATTSTPPQGWRPVHVPAPTYTLAARAPRRSYADPVVDPGTSAPVPARPQSARAYIPAPVEDEEELFHPIDLDAILEGRRAAGE